MEVVDGGRAPDSPPTDGKKPSLRIAEPSTDEPVTAPPSSTPYVTQVKVLGGHRGGGFSTTPNSSGLGDAGWIDVANGAEADSSWQTIYQGLRPRLYRITCMPGGRLDVTVDGTQIERLCPGQSIDTEGMAIRITTPDERGTGLYAPIQSVRGEE